jgi:hypothetical protein
MDDRTTFFDKVYEFVDSLNEKQEPCLKVLLDTYKMSVIEYEKTFVPFNLKFESPIKS